MFARTSSKTSASIRISCTRLGAWQVRPTYAPPTVSTWRGHPRSSYNVEEKCTRIVDRGSYAHSADRRTDGVTTDGSRRQGDEQSGHKVDGFRRHGCTRAAADPGDPHNESVRAFIAHPGSTAVVQERARRAFAGRQVHPGEFQPAAAGHRLRLGGRRPRT